MLNKGKKSTWRITIFFGGGAGVKYIIKFFLKFNTAYSNLRSLRLLQNIAVLIKPCLTNSSSDKTLLF